MVDRYLSPKFGVNSFTGIREKDVYGRRTDGRRTDNNKAELINHFFLKTQLWSSYIVLNYVPIYPTEVTPTTEYICGLNDYHRLNHQWIRFPYPYNRGRVV